MKLNLEDVKLKYRIEADSPYNDGYTREWYQKQLEEMQQQEEEYELPPHTD